MVDQRIEKMADLMVNYSVAVKPGDKVFIRGHILAEPLIREVNKKVIKAGGLPFVIPEFPGMEGDMMKYGSASQIDYIHEPTSILYGKYDCIIYIFAQDNTHALSNVDPVKIAKATKARAPIFKLYMDRFDRRELRWLITAFPTNALAQDADMSLEEYEDFVYGACMPDLTDPVGYWQRFAGKQERLVKWLKGKKNVHLVGKETDLRFSIEGRVFVNSDCKVNMPDGEIATGPVEDTMEGHVTFSYPTIYNNREVMGVQLDFSKGKVIKAVAEKDEKFLLETLDTDAGSKFVGEFAIGTNEGIQKFTKQILFDEKIAGTFHMALGKGYRDTGSIAESAIHWDMISDLHQGQIWVDDVLFYENGKFVIDG